MRRRPRPKLTFDPQDLEKAAQLRTALDNTRDLPYVNRWRFALELLPDSFFFYVVQARRRENQDELMNLYGILALTAIEDFIDLEGEEPDSEMLMMGILGITASCVGELERRYKVFCDAVEIADNPFLVDPEEPVRFYPRDPETFDRDTLIQHYVERESRIA